MFSFSVFVLSFPTGFGDFVPSHPIYMMLSIVYLIFGLALTSMCINGKFVINLSENMLLVI